MSKICCIFNIAASYRQAIYLALDKELGCDFYIGDNVGTPMKTMDYSLLRGFKGLLKNKLLSVFSWQCGIHKPMFYKYDVYIITGDAYNVSSWVLLLWARMTGRKTLLWTHGIYGNEGWAKNLLRLIYYRLSTKLLLYGDYSKELLLEKGFNPSRLDCIYNSLDYDTQLTVRKSLKQTNVYRKYFGNDNPVLFFLGRIQKVKKLYMVIDAMRMLDTRGLHFNFVCVGKDIEGVNLAEYAKERGVENRLWMYGPLFEEGRKGELMYNADICVSPGNIGLLAMDSLMYGLPTITHNDFTDQMPEFEAIKKGISGDFFERDNVTDLVDKIESWYSTHHIEGKAIIASRCHSIIDERYNPAAQIKVFKRVLNS